jgi:5-methylcytosine-specific restriction endonuclease McrA
VPVVLRLIKLIRTLFRTKVPFSKKNVMVRDGFRCMYCGDTNVRLTIDHLIPKAKGGKSTFENCVTSCKRCNSRKGDKLPSEIKMYPSKMPYQPTISQFLQEKMKSIGVEDIILDAMKG